MGVTIKDIANILGVSHTTVSRALNDSPLISQETKNRIRLLAKELNYSPNLSAKSLVLERSFNIGYFASTGIDKLQTSMFYEVADGINSELGNDYNLVIRKFADKQDIDLHFNQRKFDGMIFLSMDISDVDLIESLLERKIPMVVLNRKLENLHHASYVYIDDRSGAFSGVEYLIGLGHERIAIIGGPGRFITTGERFKGYMEALETHNLPVRKEYVAEGGFTPESGYNAMKTFLKAAKMPTAVFAANDLMAVGAMRACNELGCNIPRDFSVVGYDDMDFSQYLIPSLTTIRKPRKSMGRMGAKVLMGQISKKKDQNKSAEIATQLIIRESCCPPAE